MKTDHDNGFGMKMPALAAMTRAYSFDQFAALLNTGKPIGGRQMACMSKVSREAFAFFSDAQKRAIYDHLIRIE